jgi:restriction endonuclease S subunit
MKSDEFKHYCLGASNGTTVLHLSKSALPKYEFKLPPQQLVNNFTDIAEPLLTKLNTNQAQVLKLETLRDTLLPKLMSGTVKVNNLITA